MRDAQTPKFQLSGPTVHSLYCGNSKFFLPECHSTIKCLGHFVNMYDRDMNLNPKECNFHRVITNGRLDSSMTR